MLTWHWWYLIQKIKLTDWQHKLNKPKRDEEEKKDTTKCKQRNYESTCRFLKFITRQNQIKMCVQLARTTQMKNEKKKRFLFSGLSTSFCYQKVLKLKILCVCRSNSICSSVCLPWTTGRFLLVLTRCISHLPFSLRLRSTDIDFYFFGEMSI